MSEIDLWEDEPIGDTLVEEKSQTGASTEPEPRASSLKPRKGLRRAVLEVEGSLIRIYSPKDLRSHDGIAHDFKSIYGLVEESDLDGFAYEMKVNAVNAFILRHTLKIVNVEISPESISTLKFWADKITEPLVTVSSTRKHLNIQCNNIVTYTEILKKVNAYPTKEGWRVAINRTLDLKALNDLSVTTLPRFKFSKDVDELTTKPLSGFDGSVESLKKISIDELYVISSNLQQVKQLKKNNKTLTEKMATFGIETLHDLLFNLPKRFIDKTNPQDLSNLLVGESVTISGVIKNVGSIPNNMGISFSIGDSKGGVIKASFWRQNWLATKFKEGAEVLVTGKVTFFRGKVGISGTSIEHADEAAVLPIVPVYRQSESKGITTALIMGATRELLSRVGDLELPPYLRKHKEMSYTEALTEVHFPTSLERFKLACDVLAFYELVYMQIVIQSEKAKTSLGSALVFNGDSKMQDELIENLPFALTASQKFAIDLSNEKFSSGTPSQILLNGDVGSGKSITAQLMSLKAVENGAQVVILGPTEILARQLFETTTKAFELLSVPPRVEYFGATLKAAEKRAILKDLASGDIDVLVGTTSVISDKVEYGNLGMVIIDEQQKFGAEQRGRLLTSRKDGVVPHMILMTATPIPRSVSQIFYGGMDMIELKEKPEGRLSIETKWIQEDPTEFTQQLTNEVWADIRNEAVLGNQTFVITPMVFDSDKVDAAAVETSFKNLSEKSLKGINVGFIHGKMKKDEQNAIMERFKSKELSVLVASTVVEVGVDIKDATRVVILSADRLGASSLHQIRGRVGRNDKQSKCYLVSLGKTESSQIRMQSLVDSENGFEIALSDLTVRGEGKVFGVEQSGGSEMIFASLVSHKEWIEQASQDAQTILASQYRETALQDANDRFNVSEGLG